ncbi:MAG: DNA helicase RecQ [Erythrobacter sp.]|uniref:DNA helicase RecQ n=1 Tax=Erythrobacter sp. TaxID=1042 RepID=UPI0026060AF0|nr:DNA helicase RecQ [Erythrobacter sp.]MDJ0979339.1 DNA helicase RecQ [Erythrobacter sp.]
MTAEMLEAPAPDPELQDSSEPASVGRAAEEILRSTFGYSGFRGTQEKVIARVLRGEHTLALMPTGAGKSLCYQLPALARSGTAIVVSPLIALMHDQIRSARAVGIRAASMTSADTDNAATAEALLSGELDLLYIAPERANTQGFRRLLSQARLSLFAIDEAHCVSEWGHDFRPDYRALRPLLDAFGHVPRLALTATADRATRADILVQLGLPDDGLIVAGFDRANIRYTISAREGGARQIADYVSRRPGAGIVYASSRKGCEQLAARLQATGRRVGVYHAGLAPDQRAAVQAGFVASEDMVMVATIAFGMGIDKPDVRFVVHASLPKSIEAYYQETGRAGRDGDPAEARLFWSASDFAKARQWLGDVDDERRASERARLNALAGLVEASTCRRAILLRHFGETPPEACGNCDICLDPPTVLDATQIAKKLLSAVYRTGQSFGIGHVEKVLLGQPDERVRQRGHDALSVFGILTPEEAPLLRAVMRAALARELLISTDHAGLALGPDARAFLKGDRSFSIAKPRPKAPRRRASRSANPSGDPLFEALRAKRAELARANGIPAYIIFHDSVLREIASIRPTGLEAMAKVSGIGVKKLETYGEDFCAVVRGFA